MPTCSSGAESTQLSEYFTPGLSYWPDDRREAFTALRWHRCHLKPCSPGGENRCLAVHVTNVHAQKVKEEVIITKRHHIHTLMSGALTIHGANMLIRSNFRFSIRVSWGAGEQICDVTITRLPLCLFNLSIQGAGNYTVVCKSRFANWYNWNYASGVLKKRNESSGATGSQHGLKTGWGSMSLEAFPRCQSRVRGLHCRLLTTPRSNAGTPHHCTIPSSWGWNNQ